MNKISLLGVTINTDSRVELLDAVKIYLQNKQEKPLTIVTPNPEQIVLAQQDKHFCEILNTADIVLPDGVGLAAASRIFNFQFSIFNKTNKYPILKTISGVEFLLDLVQLAVENGWSVGFLGGREGVAGKTFSNLQKNYPTLSGWAEDGPEIREESGKGKGESILGKAYCKNLLEKIKQHNAKFLFVGLGAPKQEYFISELKHNFPLTAFPFPLVLMSVGGSFDELSGRIPMPPVIVNQFGLKWLWRLTLEPWRFFRQLRLILFIGMVVNEKMKRMLQ